MYKKIQDHIENITTERDNWKSPLASLDNDEILFLTNYITENKLV